eukprot:12917092-Prorocentrum_lima.AAC.1
MVGPSRVDYLQRRPAHADPVRQPRGVEIRFWAPARDPAVDQQVSHRVAGPGQMAYGYQFPT